MAALVATANNVYNVSSVSLYFCYFVELYNVLNVCMCKVSHDYLLRLECRFGSLQEHSLLY